MVKYQIVNPKILHGLTIDESGKRGIFKIYDALE